MSEQARKPGREELWPPFQGSEGVRENYGIQKCSSSREAVQARFKRRNPAGGYNVHTYIISCAVLAIRRSL
jgi:hypothetical protein